MLISFAFGCALIVAGFGVGVMLGAGVHHVLAKPAPLPPLRVEVVDPEDYADMVIGRTLRVGSYNDPICRTRKLATTGLFVMANGSPVSGLTVQAAHAQLVVATGGGKLLNLKRAATPEATSV